MRSIRNEKGIALVTALMMTLISLIITLALLYMVTTGTQMSASQKRYKSALEASHGTVQLFTKEIIDRAFKGYSSSQFNRDSGYAAIGLTMTGNACLQDKLTKPTAQWGNACSNTPDPKLSPDMTAILKGDDSSGFNVYAKIVDTVPGNSDMSGLELDSALGVAGTGGGISPQHLPGLYTVEVLAERGTNTREKAELSALYEY